MAADSIGATGAFLNAGATAQEVELTALCREVVVTNLHTTQALFLSVAEGSFADNPAPTAVVDADDLICVGPNQTRVVWSSPRVKRLVNLNIIATGANNRCYVEGRNFIG